MPRCSRECSETGLYHVMARGNGRQVIFESDSDREFILRLIRKSCRVHGVTVLAWCLMSNHFHLLVLDEEGHLSEMMHWVTTVYSMNFNTTNGHVGHVFQGRFLSKPVETEASLLRVIMYIHANPLEAGESDLETYRWSSYREYCEEPDAIRLADTELVLGIVGGPSEFVSMSAGYKTGSDHGIEPVRRIPDATAADMAKKVLGDIDLSELKTLSPEERTVLLKKLFDMGLGMRQVSRLTGIGRRAVARAAA